MVKDEMFDLTCTCFPPPPSHVWMRAHTNGEVIHLGHDRDSPAQLCEGVCQLPHCHQRLTPHRLCNQVTNEGNRKKK